MKGNKYPPVGSENLEFRDVYGEKAASAAMVRTQVYLTRAEHSFLQQEAVRRGEPMSAYLRKIIDEKMAIPEQAWTHNPMLDPTPSGLAWAGPEDSSLNHDFYAYGAPKKYKKVRGKWILKTDEEP